MQAAEMADYFQAASKEKRSEVLHLRIPKRLKGQLKLLADYWTQRSKMASREDAVEVTVPDVVIRLLAIGLEGAWTEAGLPAEPDAATVAEAIRGMKSPS